MNKLYRKAIIILSIVILIGCNNQNKEEEHYSESFKSFINDFRSFDLPLSFNFIGEHQLPFNIPKHPKSTKKYLYDFVNIDNSGYQSDINHITYICKLPDRNKSYVSVIYHVNYLNKHSQTILANFSKKNETRVSQLVLAGDNFRTYQLSSSIDKEGVITNDLIESMRFSWMPPFKKHPGYFFIFKKMTKYKIDENGEFVELSYKDSGRYLSVKEGFKYVYPVEAPEKEFNICTQLDYLNPKIDTNSYSKPPKGYHLLKE